MFLKKIRVEATIFFVLFFAYSYFHQGGSWIQNGRLDQVRSIVEGQKLEINDYMIYRVTRDSDGTPKLGRFRVPPIPLEEIVLIANTGDISLFEGRLYPNKPPGTVLVAVPAYFAIYAVERALSIDPDDWWVMTINAYLITVFSVGWLAALGGVAFYRISFRLFPSAPIWTHAASTMTFGLGTLMLPFATMLYDHDLVAVLSLFSLWFLLTEKGGGLGVLRPRWVFLIAGLLAGLTALMTYPAVISVIVLMLYAGFVARSWRGPLSFLAGVVLPVVLLTWYQKFCFGSVLTIANAYQNEIFHDQGMLLSGMFGVPKFDVMMKLLFSSYRGLFFTSPVLILACIGLWRMATRYEKRAEVVLFVAAFLGFLLMNSSFNHWESGWSIGPRYLIPALPFLSLPLTLVFERLPRITLAVALFSGVIMLAATAVDPQPPGGVQNPLFNYILPLLQGQVFILDGFGRGVIRGMVSANPMGVYESWFSPVFHPEIIQRQWNSFNLGEFLWPGSFASLLPLLCVLVVGLGILWHWSRVPSRIVREP